MFIIVGHPTNVGHQRWIQLEATLALVTIKSSLTLVSHKSELDMCTMHTLKHKVNQQTLVSLA